MTTRQAVHMMTNLHKLAEAFATTVGVAGNELQRGDRTTAIAALADAYHDWDKLSEDAKRILGRVKLEFFGIK